MKPTAPTHNRPRRIRPRSRPEQRRATAAVRIRPRAPRTQVERPSGSAPPKAPSTRASNHRTAPGTAHRAEWVRGAAAAPRRHGAPLDRRAAAAKPARPRRNVRVNPGPTATARGTSPAHGRETSTDPARPHAQKPAPDLVAPRAARGEAEAPADARSPPPFSGPAPGGAIFVWSRAEQGPSSRTVSAGIYYQSCMNFRNFFSSRMYLLLTNHNSRFNFVL
jgi:hypothetical protein